MLTTIQRAFVRGYILVANSVTGVDLTEEDPSFADVLEKHRDLWDPSLVQDHTAYPHIDRLVREMVHQNGGTAARNAQGLDPDQWITERLDACLGAEGVYHRQLAGLDAWLGACTEEDFLTVVDGEDTEAGELLAWAPLMSPEDSARDFINSLYEACI